MKNHYNPIGNRIRDFPACSAGPQPTAPPHRPIWQKVQTIDEIFTNEKISHSSLPSFLTKNSTELQKEMTRNGTLHFRYVFIS
jgi:hypothetical protein